MTDLHLGKIIALNEKFKNKLKDEEIKSRFLTAINSFTASVQSKHSTEEILWDAVDHAIAQLGLEDCVIYLLDSKDPNYLVQKAAYGPKKATGTVVKNPIRIPIGKGIVGYVANTGVAELINDTSQDARYIADDAIRFSEITVPILIDNKVVGVIDSEHSKRNFFSDEHVQVLNSIAQIISIKLTQLQESPSSKESGFQQYGQETAIAFTEGLNTLRRAIQLAQQEHDSQQLASSMQLIDAMQQAADRLYLQTRQLENIAC